MLDLLEIFKEFREEIYFIAFTIIIFSIEYYFRKTKKNIKKSLRDKYWEITESNEIALESDEFYIEYYKKIQLIDLIRIVLVLIFIFWIILYKSPSAFSFLAIAAWAIIITFKDAILSFLWFFYIMTNYKIWDVIIVWDQMGEIIYIKPLFVWAIWKDQNWEHNGQFYMFPNAKFITETIKKEEIKISNFQREHIDIYYSKNIFWIEYIEFKEKLTEYLDKKIKIKNIDNVWNYKTYIWYRYKMRFNYDKENLHVKLTFIEKPKKSLLLREEIISFIEWLKK